MRSPGQCPRRPAALIRINSAAATTDPDVVRRRDRRYGAAGGSIATADFGATEGLGRKSRSAARPISCVIAASNPAATTPPTTGTNLPIFAALPAVTSAVAE